jgi:iron(III) transport system ATP-binding protein
MNNALSIQNLTVKYQGQTILHDLSLSVDKGEIICLLGSSGCGKTTLLKAMAGLLSCQGMMHINGRQVLGDGVWVEPEHRNIGMIFQDYALFPHLTVSQNIAFGLKDWSTEEKKKKVVEMLALVHLTPFSDRYPHQLSGGQQQRVAIARALACEPDLVLLDEPFSNIDTQVRHGLIRDIRAIFKAQGVTAIFVTHSREEAFAFADRMAVMNDGRIEQFGSSTELYYKPSSRFVAEFLGVGSYLPITVAASNTLLTPLGQLFTSLESEQTNTSVEWLLRPQNLRINADPSGIGVILESQFMGDSCRYTVGIDEHQVFVNASVMFALGERVRVDVMPHDPVVFEVAS